MVSTLEETNLLINIELIIIVLVNNKCSNEISFGSSHPEVFSSGKSHKIDKEIIAMGSLFL